MWSGGPEGRFRKTRSSSSSSLVRGSPLSAVPAWAGTFALWRCPFSISTADHGTAHPPGCFEESSFWKKKGLLCGSLSQVSLNYNYYYKKTTTILPLFVLLLLVLLLLILLLRYYFCCFCFYSSPYYHHNVATTTTAAAAAGSTTITVSVIPLKRIPQFALHVHTRCQHRKPVLHSHVKRG